MTGFTTRLPLWPERSTLDPELESDFFPIFTEDFTEENADPKDINTRAQKLSDGDCNNWKSKKSSRRTRKGTA